MKIFNIVPECHVDTRLTELLAGVEIRNHQHGKGNVANKMKFALKNNFALGIVDEDEGRGPNPNYFEKEFQEIQKEENLILYKHQTLPHYLILICPEIEQWLTENAKAIHVLPADYKLPDDFKEFIKTCKEKEIRKNNDFNNFIKELIRKKAPGILLFKTWIEQFLAGKDL